MFPFCTETPIWWYLLPFLLGLLTGWWAWNRMRGDTAYAAPEPAYTPPVREREPDPEPVRFTTPPVAAPAAAAAVAMTAIGIPAAIGSPDDLLQIKGVGPKLNALLNSLGITRFDQIAAWGRKEVEIVDEHLEMFKGRIDRDSWIEQAGLLAKGMIKEFEAKFGTLDSENQ